jgi:hypothetical protein
MQLYRHCILKGYCHGLLCTLQAANWNFPYGATWNHGIPHHGIPQGLQFNELIALRQSGKDWH